MVSKMRTHRVGTLTLGISLVALGITFLGQMFLPFIMTPIIFKVWPVIFILLGAEILIANRKYGNEEFIYDKMSIILTMGLVLFAMFLAFLNYGIQYSIQI